MNRVDAQPNMEEMVPVDTAPSPAIPIQTQPTVNQFQRGVTPQVGSGTSPDSLQQLGLVPTKRGVSVPSLADQDAGTVQNVTNTTVINQVSKTTGESLAAPPVGKLSRTTVTITTPSITAGGNATGTVNLGKTFSVLAVATTQACRLRLYSTAAQMSADASRGLTYPPVGTEHGVILDVNLDTANGSSTSGNINVPATAMPWVYSVSQNASMSISTDGTPPVVVQTGVATGQVIVIGATTGGVRNSSSGGLVTTDGAGDPNSVAAVSGMPGYYVPPVGASTTKLMALVGAWTDAGGNVIQVVGVNNGGTFTCPAGATQFQLGFNDSGYFNNLGTASVPVTIVTGCRWKCSPEAFGSDLESATTGGISFRVDNNNITGPITLTLTLLAIES